MRIFRKAEAAAIPAVCASASVRMTPGTSGLPGKWPANIGSSLGKSATHSASWPGSQWSNCLTKTNGGRWGRERDE